MRRILLKTGILFLINTSRAGIIGLNHGTTDIGKLFLVISLLTENLTSFFGKTAVLGRSLKILRHILQ
jgi:hypothetical protein